MLMPNSRMKNILTRNGLEKGWNPVVAAQLAGVAQGALGKIVPLINAVTAELKTPKEEPEVLKNMQEIAEQWEAGLVAHLMLISMLGYDASLMFNMATQAEAEGTSAGYPGVTASALLNYLGTQAAPILGLPEPRKD